jgi:hypothetical protein
MTNYPNHMLPFLTFLDEFCPVCLAGRAAAALAIYELLPLLFIAKVKI